MGEAITTGRLAGVSVAVDARFAAQPGIGFHVYLMGAVRTLLAAGARVSMLTNFSPSQYEHLSPDAEWIGFGHRLGVVWEQIDLPLFVRRHDFDLYWAPSNAGMPLLPLRGTARLSTTHDLVPLRLPQMYLLPSPSFALPYLLWTIAAMTRSETILTVSESSADDIRRTFRRRSVVIPPVFEPIGTTSPTGPLPEQLKGRQPFVVYNGGLDPRKNVANLLRGFELVARCDGDLSLVLVGKGYDYFEPLIASLGLRDRVIRTGYVTEESKCAILAAASVMAYPSLYEGFGLPLLEAFAARTPTVTCDNSSLREVAGEAAVYVDAGDPASIADGLRRALDPELADELRRRGCERLALFPPSRSRELLVDAFARTDARRGVGGSMLRHRCR